MSDQANFKVIKEAWDDKGAGKPLILLYSLKASSIGIDGSLSALASS